MKKSVAEVSTEDPFSPDSIQDFELRITDPAEVCYVSTCLMKSLVPFTPFLAYFP